MDPDLLRPRYDDYCEAREGSRFRAHAGLAHEPLHQLADRFDDLTSGEPLEALRAAAAEESFASKREGFTRLAHCLEGAVLEARRFALAHGWARTRGGEREERVAEACAELAELRAKLGYQNARARFRALFPALDPDRFEGVADRLLDATEARHRDLLEPALERAGTPLAGAAAADVAALLARSACDEFFPAGQRVDYLAFTLQGMEIRDLAGVEVDDEAREGRTSDARSFALRVPGSVLLSLGPAGGVAACRDAFVASGRALGPAFSSAELPVERRREGDPALGLGFGLLLGDLVSDPTWLAASPASQRDEQIAREGELQRLVMLRRTAGQLRYELLLSELPPGEDPARLTERGAEELGRALGVAVSGEGLLEGSDPELTALHELRALCFAAQLREFLRQEFGRAFWKERRCGELLKELWNTGTSYDADSLAAELGFGPLDVEHLL